MRANLTSATPQRKQQSRNTSWTMRQAMLALLPGCATLSYLFGPGTLLNILVALVCALGGEVTVLKLRGRRTSFAVRDGSAALTAMLIGVSLPPASPWWLVASGSLFAIIVVKHLYGGLGHNTFNPAMAAYAFLMLCFPFEMSHWPLPHALTAPGSSDPAFLSGAIRLVAGAGAHVDGMSGATALAALDASAGLMFEELRRDNPVFGAFGSAGWEWVNAGFLAGGIYLAFRRIIDWRISATMLGSLGICAILGFDSGSSNGGGSATFHLFSGATMLCAFFVATDPVTSAASRAGRLLQGALAGTLLYAIRCHGAYPDGAAFAVLICNATVPLLDRVLALRGSSGYGNSNAQSKTTEAFSADHSTRQAETYEPRAPAGDPCTPKRDNAPLLQLICLAPMLGACSSLIKALAIATVFFITLVSSSALLEIAGRRLRGIATPVMSAILCGSLVTILDLVLQAIAWPLQQSLGPYLPLVAASCVLLLRYDAKQGLGEVDARHPALREGLAFLLVAAVFGASREILGDGMLLGDAGLLLGYPGTAELTILAAQAPLRILKQAAGVFMLAGLLAAAIRYFGPKLATRSSAKQFSTATTIERVRITGKMK